MDSNEDHLPFVVLEVPSMTAPQPDSELSHFKVNWLGGKDIGFGSLCTFSSDQ